MKFKLDENIGDIGKVLLIAAGHEVTTVLEQGANGWNDMLIYELCRDEGRVLVTLDRDFGQTLRFPPEKTCGIVVLACPGRQSSATISARIKELIETLKSLRIDGALWIVEPGRLRIHERGPS